MNVKKEYLELYLIQQAKIERLRDLMRINPKTVRRYRKKIRDAERLRRRIEDTIDAVDGGILSEVLSQRFLCGKSLEQIALTLNYSKRHIERLFIRAMEKIDI
ncbi:MAG: hypothetical protein IJF35_00725 [Clostridia bacterium]|nr:hypothetical protein [Oscillospiraceae bacterium]MBQ2746228.1 hypothetical protein [Clostridia bacterium]